MLLAVDIGNTRISAGLFRGPRIGTDAAQSAGDIVGEGPVAHWSLATSAGRTSDEYALSLRELVSASGFSVAEITGAILCSVVPAVTATVASAVEGCIGAMPLVLADGESAGVAAGMPVLADRPAEVGADRVVAAVAAFNTCGGPAVVVDMGTAITVDLVSEAGEFSGGAIAPGIRMSAEALHRGTASLPMPEPMTPARAVGTNTIESMASGLYYGFAGLVDGLVAAVAAESGTNPRVVATGGDVAFIKGASSRITLVDEFLTLKGLKVIFDKI